MTLKRYEPRRSLRSSARQRQTESLLKRGPDYSKVYEALIKRRQEQEEQKRYEQIAKTALTKEQEKRPESATQLAQSQFTPSPETGLPEAGKEFGPASEKKDTGFWKKVGGVLENLAITGAGIGEVLLTPKPEEKSYTPLGVLRTVLQDAPYFKQKKERKKILDPKYKEAGITAKDVAADIFQLENVFGTDPEAFEKFKEIQQTTQKIPIPGSGKVLQAFAASTPAGTAIPLTEQVYPDVSPSTIDEFIFDPLWTVDLGAAKIITAPIKTISKFGGKSVLKTTLNRTNAGDRAFTDINAALTPEELSEVISWNKVRPQISEDLLPNTVFDADFELYSKLGMAVPRSATGISKSTLYDLTLRLEKNVIDSNDWLIGRKFGKRKGLEPDYTFLTDGKKIPGHSATDFIVPFTDKKLNLFQQEELLRQLNAFWKNDTITKMGYTGSQSFDFQKTASRLRPNELHLQSRPGLRDLFKDKSQSKLRVLGDFAIGRRGTLLWKQKNMNPLKLMKFITGSRTSRPYYDEMHDIVSGKMEHDVSYYLEGVNYYFDAKQRIMPQFIERDLIKLRRTGSPIKVNENGILKVRDTLINEKTLRNIGIVPKLDKNQQVVLPTSEFLGKFFSKEKPYWKLTGADHPDIARNTPLGKWVSTYQNIIKESLERNKYLGGNHLLNVTEDIDFELVMDN